MSYIKVWKSDRKQDSNIYAFLNALEEAAKIKIDVDNAPFGIGHLNNEFVIQADGISWFLKQCPNIKHKLPIWVIAIIDQHDIGY